MSRPSFKPRRNLVWGYAKHYAEPIPGIRFYEEFGKRCCKWGFHSAIRRFRRLPNARGMFLVYCAEVKYPLPKSGCVGSVVRPCLADYRGFGIISGTSNGDDHFHALLQIGTNHWLEYS